MQDLQDLGQDLASLVRKILARFGYILQDGFYWVARGYVILFGCQLAFRHCADHIETQILKQL